MKLILLIVWLRLTILWAEEKDRGDCIPEQSPCKNAASNCCNPAEWACRWREEFGYRCYERFPLFAKGSSCIPKGDLCVPGKNDKCCNKGDCRVLSIGVQCSSSGPGPWKRLKSKNCTKTKVTHGDED